MFMEFDYTLNINESTVHGLHKMIETSASAIEAATVTHPTLPYPIYRLKSRVMCWDRVRTRSP